MLAHNPNNRFTIGPSQNSVGISKCDYALSTLELHREKSIGTHGRISHQEIRSKCEQHDCISVKMLFKLNDQINF